MKLRSSIRMLLVAAVLVLIGGGLGSLLAQEVSTSDEVVTMLEADMSEEVILAWLQGQGSTGGPLSADELVALKSAGASSDLLKAMIEWARREPPTAAAPTLDEPPLEVRLGEPRASADDGGGRHPE